MGKLKKNSVNNKLATGKTEAKRPNLLSRISRKKEVSKIRKKSIASPLTKIASPPKPAEDVPPVASGDDASDFQIDEATVKSAIRAIFQLHEAKKAEKTSSDLFNDELPIFLQISCIKIAKCPVRTVRLQLQNSLLKNTSEICLIVANLNNKARREHDKTIEEYENLLRSKGVTNIKVIMPLHQLKTEYDQYEMKRKLINLYDAFLVEGKVSNKVAHLLGKVFSTKRKLPTPVKLHVPKLKEHIESALKKSAMNIHPNGNNFVVQVAHTNMNGEAIFQNVISAFGELGGIFPGGTKNVRSVHLKCSSTTSVPVYITLRKTLEVKVPVVKAKRPKNFKTVSGEFSSLLHANVHVDPYGGVSVIDEVKAKVPTADEVDGGSQAAGKYVRLQSGMPKEEDGIDVAGKYVRMAGKKDRYSRDRSGKREEMKRKISGGNGVHKRKNLGDRTKKKIGKSARRG